MGFTEAILGEIDPKKIKRYSKKVFNRSKHMSSVISKMSGYVRTPSTAGKKEVDLNERIDVQSRLQFWFLGAMLLNLKFFSSIPPNFGKI